MGSVDHELCCKMDELALKSLELMEEILVRRSLMDGVLKDGFIDMAKARYSMGNHAVSVLQLPTEDSEVEAKRRVFSRTVSENVPIPYTEFSLELVSHNSSEVCNDKSDENILRKRNPEEISKIKNETSPTENPVSDTNSSKGKKRKDLRHKDPLLWFGVLVPANLKESQKSFQKAVSFTCEIATLQSELRSVLQEFRTLRKQKCESGKKIENLLDHKQTEKNK